MCNYARFRANRCPTPPEDEVAPHFFFLNRVPHPYIGLKIGYMRLPSQKNTFLKFVSCRGGRCRDCGGRCRGCGGRVCCRGCGGR